MRTQSERLLYLVDISGLENASDFARAAGIEPGTMRQHVNRNSIPRHAAENYCRVVARAGATTEWLLDGKGPAPHKPDGAEARSVLPRRSFPAGLRDQAVEFEGTRFLSVRYFDARVHAGPGGDGSDEVLDRYLFREASLRRITQAPLEQLGIVEVDGDSMEPTLRSGDHVLVDLQQNRPTRKDGIYVLRGDAGLQVKRISAHPVSKRLTIKCDNDRYEAYHDVPVTKVEVLGRVVWLGRRI